MKSNPLALELEAYATSAPDLKRRMLRDALARVKEAARLRFNFAAALGAVAELRAERDAALADARRYRWLREVGMGSGAHEVDAAIDAALKDGK